MATTARMKSYAQRIAERLDIDAPEDLDNFVQVREWLNANTEQYIEYQRQHGQQDAANDANPLAEYKSLSPSKAPTHEAAQEPPAPKDLEHFFAESKDGKEVIYRWRDNARAAFSDHGDHIQLHDKSPESQEAIIAASLAIAKERAWREIEVTGDQDFRRQVWLEANLAGFQVRGYIPTLEDKQELEKLRPGSAPAHTDMAQEAKITAAANFHGKGEEKDDPRAALDATLDKLDVEDAKRRRIYEIKAVVADEKPTERRALDLIVEQNRGNAPSAPTPRGGMER